MLTIETISANKWAKSVGLSCECAIDSGVFGGNLDNTEYVASTAMAILGKIKRLKRDGGKEVSFVYQEPVSAECFELIATEMKDGSLLIKKGK